MPVRITWGELGAVLGGLLPLYYAIYLFVFYRKRLTDMTGGRSGAVWTRQSFQPEPTGKPDIQPSLFSDDDVYSAVHALSEELKKVFEAGIEDHLDRDQILEAVKSRLRNYPVIKGSSFQQAVNNYIQMELQNKCGIEVTSEVLNDSW
ncbi:MAG: hypothetical protein ABUL46_01535 [Chitinophaga rupis]